MDTPHNKIRQATDEAVEAATAALASGQLVGVPTETVYGLAANAFDRQAVQRIYDAKGRPPKNPLIVHVASVQAIETVAFSPMPASLKRQIDRVSSFWPGPLTVVLPRDATIPDIVTAGLETVAVRVPSHPVMRRLLSKCSFPLAAPSANRSKYVSPTTAEHVADGLGDRIAMVLDGGKCSVGIESTILQLGEPPRLLRPGSITCEMLADCLELPAEQLLVRQADTTNLLAPGMMPKHYSPRTRLVFADHDAAKSVNAEQTGRLLFSDSSETERYAAVEVLSADGDLNSVAQNLFAALRRLDQRGLALIVADRCEEQGVGRAIMDRLRRASAE